jgi:hypothetical protein
MRRLLVSILSGAVLLFATSAWALEPAEEGTTKIKLNVLAFVDLQIIDGECDITPGPEDYANSGTPCEAEKVDPVPEKKGTPVNQCDKNDLVVNEEEKQKEIPSGFAERSDCLEISIFTNARGGADVFVYGNQPEAMTGILRLEDIYFTIEVEKTYICANNLEGCKPNANTCEKPKMGACWLRINNEAQHLISVSEATKAPRNITIKVGIGNLARYTEGEYTADVVVVLMPTV